jgi:hypothetical protein
MKFVLIHTTPNTVFHLYMGENNNFYQVEFHQPSKGFSEEKNTSYSSTLCSSFIMKFHTASSEFLTVVDEHMC